jgi:hypothetical protein
MKKKNVFIALLVVLALAIWSHNLYRIFIGVTRSDQEMDEFAGRTREALPDTILFSENQQPAFVYSGAHRDPFAHWLVQPEKKIKPVPAASPAKIVRPEPAPPRLRLSGIVRDAAGVLAIVEDPQGEIHFAKPEDVVAGVKLVRIDSARVICEFDKRQYALELR